MVKKAETEDVVRGLDELAQKLNVGAAAIFILISNKSHAIFAVITF